MIYISKYLEFIKRKINLFANLPIFLSIIILLASFLFTLNGLKSNTEELSDDNKRALRDFNSNVKKGINKEIGIMTELMLPQWLDITNLSDLFNYDRYLKIIPLFFNFSNDFLAINWINSSGYINWVYPYERNIGAINKSILFFSNGGFNDAFNYTRTTNNIGFTHLIPFYQGGTGFASYIPIISNETITGYFNIVFELSNLFETIFDNQFYFSKFSYLIYENGAFFPNMYSNFSINDSFVISEDVSIFSMNWTIYSRPVESEIWKTSISSVFNIFVFEFIFCAIIYVISSVLKKKNDLLKREFIEKEKIMDNLMQDKKLKALGRLAGGIAHDFNNILTNIIGHLKLVELEIDSESFSDQTLSSNENIRYSLSVITKNISRSKDLINQILAFSKNKVINYEVFNLKDVILDSLNLFKERFKRQIQFITDLEDCIFVYADQTQLIQIFMNILINSINAVNKDDAFIKITCKFDTEKYNEFLLNKLKKKNLKVKFLENGCIITIRDNGKGMNQKQLEDAFDPFSTIKSSGTGSGLGLGIVHNNVTSLGGLVSIKSELDKFTELEVKLPSILSSDVNGARKFGKNQKENQKIDFKKLTIFLIDDEVDLVESFSKILTKLGSNVITSSDSHQAWQIYQNYAFEIDFVILDMKMPGLNGIDLIKLIRNYNMNQKIIIISGFSDDFTEIENMAILQKPFDTTELLDRLISFYDKS